MWTTGSTHGAGTAARACIARTRRAYWTFLSSPFPATLSDTGDMRDVRSGIRFLRSAPPGRSTLLSCTCRSACRIRPTVRQSPSTACTQAEELPPLRPPDLPGKPDLYSLIRQYRRLDQVDEDVFDRSRPTYLGMNSYVDWMLGELLRCLDETGLAENTTLIIAVRSRRLGRRLWPGRKVAQRDGRHADARPAPDPHSGRRGRPCGRRAVELFDVMPTVLELAGIQARHTHLARSLVPQLHGAAGDPERAVFCEGGYDTHEPQCFEGRADSDALFRDVNNIYYPKGLQQQEHPESVCRTTMLRTSAFKLVRRTAGVNELYDLKQDPRELHNRYADPTLATVRQTLESRMLDWSIHTADVVRYQHPRGLPRRLAAFSPDKQEGPRGPSLFAKTSGGLWRARSSGGTLPSRPRSRTWNRVDAV